MRIWFLVVLWTTSGCASLFGSGTSEKKAAAVTDVPAKAEPQAVSQAETKENDLKASKIWARMEELENEIIRQKERMRLLERGLITGIVPDELARGYEKEKAPEPSGVEGPKAIVPPVAAAPSEPTPTLPPEPIQPVQAAPAIAQNTDENAYQDKLSRAHALFSGDHWGQAIAAYGAIAQEFPESMTQGHPVYWVGLSWFHLKEYQLAEKNLTDFLNRFAASPLAPRAHFYLAKTEFQMGLVEKAVGRFRNVIRDFPADEAAKMAKLEISRLDQAL